ncbi:MAG: serine/threonine-protein kinase [Planctomycetota bacterium]
MLQRYESGRLRDVDAFPIEQHLTRCQRCRESLDHIRHEDSQAARIRSAFHSATETEGTASLDTQAALPPVGKAVGNPGAIPDPNWPIPDYERVVLCGEGSYGSVWVVRDRVGAYRALKMIDTARLTRAGIKCREREALEVYVRKISSHPYLISIYHVGEFDNLLYYTMELADNQSKKTPADGEFPTNYAPLTLDNIIRSEQLRIDIAMEIARRLLRGLSKLHAMDLVHRDIKPSNIIFVERHPKLADIGMMTSDAYGSKVVGTPGYIPPDHALNATADVYAFGKVLYEMLCGHNRAEFPQLPHDERWYASKWPQDRVQEIIDQACAPNAGDRYDSAGDMLEDLEACNEPTFESLYEELATPAPVHNETTREAIQLGFAALRLVPWIIGLIAFLELLKHLPR